MPRQKGLIRSITEAVDERERVEEKPAPTVDELVAFPEIDFDDPSELLGVAYGEPMKEGEIVPVESTPIVSIAFIDMSQAWGLVFDKLNDELNIYDCLQTLLSKQEHAKKIAEGGQQYLRKHHTVSRMTNALMQTYRDAQQKHKTPSAT